MKGFLRKKFWQAVLLQMILSVALLSGTSAAQAQSENDSFLPVTAWSAILIDGHTKEVVYQKDADVRRYPASTTKMMTLLVALERADMNDVVTVSAKAANTEGSSLELKTGEKIVMKDLLLGMMLESGNDAAVAVAEHVAGSVPAFAKLMNEKAKQIGATHTHFVNPNGLPNVNHYTTARDLALIAAYGYEHYPLFRKIVSTKEARIPHHSIENTNQLLWTYKGADGVKTGTTDAAGYCLVSSATRNKKQFIAVVLHSEDRWRDSKVLLDYAFETDSLLN